MRLNNWISRLALHIRERPKLLRRFRELARQVSPESIAVLDYPVKPVPRWVPGRPHPQLNTIIEAGRERYQANLESFSQFTAFFARIPELPDGQEEGSEPRWLNGFTPGLDGAAIYGFIVTGRPNLFMEVGSGNSTKFARRAILDHGLSTKIVSIDPKPRAGIDGICDEVIRRPVENLDLGLFDQLEANDILYVDSSHRVLMNSDGTTILLDVLPRLKPGVLVALHDVNLPFDYPIEWGDRFYSEQYLLAAYLLAGGDRYRIELPSTFIGEDPELAGILDSLWEKAGLHHVERHGSSFWMRVS